MLPALGTPLVAAAAAYLDLGLLPIPVYGVRDTGECTCGNPECKAPGKHPVGAQWQKRAPRTLDDARDAFDGHDGNIGVCVASTPFVVLDFDGEPGLATLAELEAADLVPETLRARSGGGGAHLFFQLADWHDAGAISDRRVGPAWDVKKHGQVLAAPSRHASGGTYEWIHEAPIAQLPDVLFERVRRPVAIVPSPPPAPLGGDLAARARAYVDRMPPAIAGSGGHNATFAVARKLLQDFGLGEGDSWAILLEYNARCEPPWTEKELRHKLDSARKAHTRVPIADRPLRAVSRSNGSAALANDPDPPPPPPPHAVDDWRGRLLWADTRTGKRKLVTHAENVIRILALHPKWRGRLRYDEFRGRIVVRDPPWDEYQRPTSCEAAWTDEDATRLHAWLRREFHPYAFAPSVTDCERAVDVAARTNGWHPVREYLESLRWDQTLRLKRMGATYFGADDDDYTANVMRWWMISAVARVLRPGCKADHVLILEGKQGRGKSTALGILGGEWFNDTPIDLNSKDAFGAIRGRWIVELAELDSLFRVESSRAKAFFSSSVDNYRPAYGRREREQPRSCVFAGSVNEGVYLRDPTGARRFWPVRCRVLDLAALRRDRDQLWAEALYWFREGARWWPEGVEEVEPLEAQQEERTERDEWTDAIEKYVARAGAEVTGAEILEFALRLEPKDWTRQAQTRVGAIMMHGLRWSKHRGRVGEIRTWVYRRPVTGQVADRKVGP